jgi:pimeloyl-ACP methyl ester carboxylesterase
MVRAVFPGGADLTETTPNLLPAFKSDESRARYLAAYDAVLAAWPVPSEEIDLPTPLGTTHVIASGRPEAPPLVLLPSFAGTATVWRLNVEALSQRFRTYAVDVIGQPGKSLAVRRPRDRHDYAGWLVDLLDGLKVERAAFAGCSFGAFLALNQAALTPERVERAIAIDPVGVFASQYWRLFYAMRIRRPLLRLARRLTGARRAASMADLVRRPPRDSLWAAQMAVTMAESPEVAVINPPVLTRAELRGIRPPVLLLIGADETLYDPAQTLALARSRIPGLAGAVIPAADHIAAMAQPDDVNARILAFLEAGR